jgi:hypothetical protein
VGLRLRFFFLFFPFFRLFFSSEIQVAHEDRHKRFLFVTLVWNLLRLHGFRRISGEDHLVPGGALARAKVDRRGLQGVEDQAGITAVDAVLEDGTDDAHEDDLDGVGIVREGQVGGGDGPGIGAVGEVAAEAVVVVAEAVSAEGGGAALGAVELDVLTAGHVARDDHHGPRLRFFLFVLARHSCSLSHFTLGVVRICA